MRVLIWLLAGGLSSFGVAELFRAQRASRRLRGAALLALGGVILLAASGPARGAAIAAAAVSAVTLVGLLLVARAMERTGTNDGAAELRLDVDPQRWS